MISPRVKEASRPLPAVSIIVDRNIHKAHFVQFIPTLTPTHYNFSLTNSKLFFPIISGHIYPQRVAFNSPPPTIQTHATFALPSTPRYIDLPLLRPVPPHQGEYADSLMFIDVERTALHCNVVHHVSPYCATMRNGLPGMCWSPHLTIRT